MEAPEPLGVLPQDRPWRQWYQLEVWRRRRRLQLAHEPLCKFCSERGVVTPATIADHVVSHGGDWNSFRLGALQSLCSLCHGSIKRRADLDGFDAQTIDDDGWPLDPRHPTNRDRARRRDNPANQW